MKTFSHLDAEGRARMVDVGHKPPQLRVAVAAGCVRCQPATINALRAKKLPKGDVCLPSLKSRPFWPPNDVRQLIPLCHSLPLDAVEVNFSLEEKSRRHHGRGAHDGENRRGNGGIDRGERGGFDDLRHVQGG